MRARIIIGSTIALFCSFGVTVADPLNYDDMIYLDAESLAEAGIKDAYDSLQSRLSEFVPRPAPIIEQLDNNVPSYVVVFGDEEFSIYTPDLKEGEGNSWGRATYALFTIVNAQLADTDHRFYAISGGHDLGGMFLTNAEVDAAKHELTRKTDWPYLPTLEHPWYGQNH